MPAVIALVRDLVFASHIRAAAAGVGVELSLARSPAALEGLGTGLLLVDLGEAGFMEAAMAWRSATGGRVVGFVSHVDTQTIRAARSAGMDRVLARSRFVEVLPDLVARAAAGADLR